MKDLDMLLAQLKKAGIAPEVVHVKIAVSDAEEIASLQEKLTAAGVSSEVHINLQLGPGGKEASLTTSTTIPTGSGSTPTDNFEVEVKGAKALLRFYKDTEKGTNNQGKPIMLIREPRIKLDKGERLSVSASHKETRTDKGNGVIDADGIDDYYLVTDPRFDAGVSRADKIAAKFDDGKIKLFIRERDVKRV